MEITYKPRQTIKWVEVKEGTLFLTEEGLLCFKLPECNDKHGPANCYSFKDNKYYFFKDHQSVGKVARMSVII